MSRHLERVLAVHPIQEGFGWILMEGAARSVDWGVAVVSGDRNSASLARIEGLIDDLKPDMLVLEAFNKPHSRRSERVRRLCQDILDLAQAKGIETGIHAREDIWAYFDDPKIRSRFEIATAIAGLMDEIAHELPPKRKIWLPEDPRMSIFNAAAVALTHYWLTSGPD